VLVQAVKMLVVVAGALVKAVRVLMESVLVLVLPAKML
jgi:hypothetical protein